MRLDNVETLIKPTIAAINRMSYIENIRLMGEAPFRDILRIPTDFEICSPSLFETADGNACLGFIEDPSRIRLILLNGGKQAMLEFTDYPGHTASVSYLFSALPSRQKDSDSINSLTECAHSDIFHANTASWWSDLSLMSREFPRLL